MKQTIKLTESQLTDVIRKTVRRVVKEDQWDQHERNQSTSAMHRDNFDRTIRTSKGEYIQDFISFIKDHQIDNDSDILDYKILKTNNGSILFVTLPGCGKMLKCKTDGNILLENPEWVDEI